ncbi:MAG: hypothetical protein M1548_09565 [Actinobacteria bacterium]|nr:hypothetical protein [Actinomycetota bacterium]
MNSEQGASRRVTILVSSVGLGHVFRELAIVNELRRIIPDLEATWVTTHPNTIPLEELGESVHPLSSRLKPASLIAETSAEPAFRWDSHKSIRRMNTLYRLNSRVVREILASSTPNLVIADEAMELMILLELQPYISWSLAYITDSPLPYWVNPTIASGPFSRVSDYFRCRNYVRFFADWLTERGAAIFIGTNEDVPDLPMGPGLPKLRSWFEKTFQPVGYVINFNPNTPTAAGKYSLKERLGYDPDKRVIIASVGGTAIGQELLEKVDLAADALTAATESDVEVVLVTGPRLPPEKLKLASGRSLVKSYVPRLYEHFAAADFAVVMGSLSSAVELAAVGTPFVYVPVAGHTEQEHNVAARLDRLGVGQKMSFMEMGPNRLASAFRKALNHQAQPPKVALPLDGARRAAEILASVLQESNKAEAEGR